MLVVVVVVVVVAGGGSGGLLAVCRPMMSMSAFFTCFRNVSSALADTSGGMVLVKYVHVLMSEYLKSSILVCGSGMA